MGPDLRVSIIIPTYGLSKYLNQALSSVQLQECDGEEYEIIVVDNSPSGTVRDVVEEANRNGPHPVRYVREPHVGLHNARHAGAREARGEILVYIDDDVVVHPEWLAAMVRPFDRPEVGCVGGKVIAKWEREPPEWWSQFHPGYLSLLDLAAEQIELKRQQAVHGCNMGVGRSVLYEVGRFSPDAVGDHRYIWLRGHGETGLHKKIYNAGYKVTYEPQAWVYHQIPASRLTPRYFYWRAFIQGISDSYSRVREISVSRILLLRLLWHGVRCLIKAALCYVAVIQHPDKRMLLRSDTWYWYGRECTKFGSL